MQAFTNVPECFPVEHQSLHKTSQFYPCEPKTVNFCPPERRMRRITIQMKRRVSLPGWGRHSPSDWQSADSRRINAGSVEAGKIRSLLLRNKDTHIISSLLLSQRGEKRLENRIYSLCYFHWSHEVSTLLFFLVVLQQYVTSLT